MYYFKTEHLSVGYENTPLIQNIEIRLEKGNILTLIGPNGAGKSTILKSIAKQLKTIDGCIYLGQKELNAMSGKELSRSMAVVLTEKLNTELMTCRDVVATGRYPYTGHFGILSKTDGRIVEEAMELVHVREFSNRDFTEISDGQRQRVMLARAICQQPEIIILDEPTSFLDVKHKLEFLSVLQELRDKKGLTVIMSLHELELAERVSDMLLCVRGTYVDRFGRSETVFTPGYIRELFDIRTGSFDEENGSMELEPAKGNAEVFVIGGNGSARQTFRRLQREKIPFNTGILFENDLDYPSAKALASEVVTAKAFEPITEEQVQTAKKSIENCKRIICCRKLFGSFEKANEELLLWARRQGKSIQYTTACHGESKIPERNTANTFGEEM